MLLLYIWLDIKSEHSVLKERECNILDFKLSLCSECCMLPSGRYTVLCGYTPTFRNILYVPYSRAGSYEEYLLAYEDGTGSFETLTFKIQTPGNHPEESIQQIVA
jgi:hypothetical protein